MSIGRRFRVGFDTVTTAIMADETQHAAPAAQRSITLHAEDIIEPASTAEGLIAAPPPTAWNVL